MLYDATKAECRVHTYKEGMLSAFGHDLILRVTRFTIEVSDDESTLEARFDARSLRVVGAVVQGALEPDLISARDRASIEAAVSDDVLHAKRYPEIRFVSTEISPEHVRGRLRLHGVEQEIKCHRTGPAVVEATLHQPDFGITPYRAMLGALKIQPHVKVEVKLP